MMFEVSIRFLHINLLYNLCRYKNFGSFMALRGLTSTLRHNSSYDSCSGALEIRSTDLIQLLLPIFSNLGAGYGSLVLQISPEKCDRLCFPNLPGGKGGVTTLSRLDGCAVAEASASFKNSARLMFPADAMSTFRGLVGVHPERRNMAVLCSHGFPCLLWTS